MKRIFPLLAVLGVWLAAASTTRAGEQPCGDISLEQLRKSAAEGSPAAQKDLADLLASGRCVREDDAEAVIWYRRSAEQNHHSAQYALGQMLAEGGGGPKNAVEGYMWIRLSAPKSDRHTREVLEKMAKSMSREDVLQAERNAVEWMRSHLENARPAPKK